MTISARRVDTMCNDNVSTTRRWAPFSLPDDFDVTDATCLISWLMAMRGGRGGAPGGKVEGLVGTLLIVELGSPFFFVENTMVVLLDAISQQKLMVRPPTKYLYRLNRGRGTRWWCQNWPGGWYDGVISIFNRLNLWALYRPWPTRINRRKIAWLF